MSVSPRSLCTGPDSCVCRKEDHPSQLQPEQKIQYKDTRKARGSCGGHQERVEPFLASASTSFIPLLPCFSSSISWLPLLLYPWG